MCVYGDLSESGCNILNFHENVCSRGRPFCDMLKEFHEIMIDTEAPEILNETYGRASGYVEALFDADVVEGWRASSLHEITIRTYRAACARL